MIVSHIQRNINTTTALVIVMFKAYLRLTEELFATIKPKP